MAVDGVEHRARRSTRCGSSNVHLDPTGHNERSFAAYATARATMSTCNGSDLQLSLTCRRAAGHVILPGLVSSKRRPTARWSTAMCGRGRNGTPSMTIKSMWPPWLRAPRRGAHVTTQRLAGQVGGGTLTYTLTFANPGARAVAANLTLPLPGPPPSDRPRMEARAAAGTVPGRRHPWGGERGRRKW